MRYIFESLFTFEFILIEVNLIHNPRNHDHEVCLSPKHRRFLSILDGKIQIQLGVRRH